MIGTDRSRWTLREIAQQQLDACGERVFLQEVNGHEAETYRLFIGRAVALAEALSNLGVRKGDAVGIICHNGPPGLHAWLAGSLIGAVEVPISPFYRGEMLRHVLTVCMPNVIVADTQVLPALAAIEGDIPFVRDLIVVDSGAECAFGSPSPNIRVHSYDSFVPRDVFDLPDVPVRPWDIASVMFTSGTTGPSKGVMMPNAQVCLLALQSIGATRMTSDDVFYCAHPMSHIAGKFMGVFATFASGGRVVLDRRFDAGQWLASIRRYGVTLSIAHGPMIEMIQQVPPSEDDGRHAMRRLMCCPLPRRIGEAFEKRFALRGIEMWGMTEVGCPCWTSLDGTRVPGSCGRTLSEWYDLRIVDPETDEPLIAGRIGEIVVRPRHPWTTMQGYVGMPAETVEAWRNMWFHTGDGAYADVDGNVFFVDRIKDRIRRRAENISSYDIESAAIEFPNVREAAVVGVSSGFEGDDDIKLCVVANPGTSIEPLRLLEFLAGRLPHSMVPRYIDVMEALPRTPTNKIRKRELRDMGITSETWDRHRAGVSLRRVLADLGG